jgi:hypothetical protein
MDFLYIYCSAESSLIYNLNTTSGSNFPGGYPSDFNNNFSGNSNEPNPNPNPSN